MNRFPLERRSDKTKYGSYLHLAQDSGRYLAMPGQRFIPREVLPDTFDWHAFGKNHPFLGKEGDLVAITDWVAGRWFGGAATGFISRVRTMRTARSTKWPPTHQVEILGLPTVWFAASHFEPIN